LVISSSGHLRNRDRSFENNETAAEDRENGNHGETATTTMAVRAAQTLDLRRRPTANGSTEMHQEVANTSLAPPVTTPSE
jgi:hypothetical protein